jgi:glucan 1,3-beta-glucosidase
VTFNFLQFRDWTATTTMPPPDSPRRKRRERSHHHHSHHHHRRASHSGSPRKSRAPATSSDSSTQALSAGALAKLNYLNQQPSREPEVTPKKNRQKRERVISEEKFIVERTRKQHKRKKRRVVSGALLEEAEGEKLRSLRAGTYNYEKVDGGGSFLKRKKRLCLLSSQMDSHELKLTFLVRDMHWHFGPSIGYYNTGCCRGHEKE